MPKFDDVNVGDELPTLTKSPDRAQLVGECSRSDERFGLSSCASTDA